MIIRNISILCNWLIARYHLESWRTMRRASYGAGYS